MWRVSSASWLIILGALFPIDKPPGVLTARTVWDIVRSQDGDFAFSMPAKPTLETQNVQGSAGAPEVLRYSCLVDGSQYQIQRARAPQSVAPGQVIAELAKLRKGYFKENVRLVKETKVVVDGVIGEDFTYTVPSPQGDGETTCRTRHLLTNRFYYVLTVTSPPGKPLSIDAARFVSTLTFEAAAKAYYVRMRTESKTPARPPATAPRRPAQAKGAARGPKTKVNLADSTPEEALKTFLLAWGAQDAETLRSVTLPDKDFDWLLKDPPVPAEVLAQMKSHLEEKPMRRLKAGDPVRMPNGESRVIQPDDVREGRVVLWPDGAPLPSRIEKVGEHWKVFALPFIAARKAAEANTQQAKPKSVGPPR